MWYLVFFDTVVILVFTASQESYKVLFHSSAMQFFFSFFFPPEQEENGQRKDKTISISLENVYVVEVDRVVLIAREHQFTN